MNECSLVKESITSYSDNGVGLDMGAVNIIATEANLNMDKFKAALELVENSVKSTIEAHRLLCKEHFNIANGRNAVIANGRVRKLDEISLKIR